VFINTQLLQAVLRDQTWADKLTSEDRRGLSPLLWANVNPYGRFRLDMESRLDLGRGNPAGPPLGAGGARRRVSGRVGPGRPAVISHGGFPRSACRTQHPGLERGRLLRSICGPAGLVRLAQDRPGVPHGTNVPELVGVDHRGGEAEWSGQRAVGQGDRDGGDGDR
jgi:hypothetical protein